VVFFIDLSLTFVDAFSLHVGEAVARVIALKVRIEEIVELLGKGGSDGRESGP
jgi:hypothetical protein